MQERVQDRLEIAGKCSLQIAASAFAEDKLRMGLLLTQVLARGSRTNHRYLPRTHCLHSLPASTHWVGTAGRQGDVLGKCAVLIYNKCIFLLDLVPGPELLNPWNFPDKSDKGVFVMLMRGLLESF